MTVLLAILKGAGILLLSILILLLAVLTLLLIVPFRYRLEGAYQEKLTLQGKVTWLLHFVSVRASYDGTLTYGLKLAGISFEPGRIRQSRIKKAIRFCKDRLQRLFEKLASLFARSLTAPVEEEEEQEELPKEGDSGEKARTEETASGGGDDTDAGSEETREAIPKERSENADASEQETAEEKQSFGERIKGLEEKLESAQDKLDDIRDNLEYYLDLLGQARTQEALKTVTGQLLRMLRHILPSRLAIHAILGIPDPAAMGQLMAVQGMLYPVLHQKVWIEPDFEEKRMEGTLAAQGRIRLVTLLFCALRIILKRDVIYLIKRLRRKKED